MHANIPFPGILEPDPKLYLRLKANAASQERTVLGRRLRMEVDAFGCRPVAGQPAMARTTFAAYGCSYTYGHALPVEETFCSLLQQLLPDWRIENHGVPGYGTTQNLLQLWRNSLWGAADYVTFCWIPHHLLRSVGDAAWITSLAQGIDPALPDRASRFPKARLNRDGDLELRYIDVPRRDLAGLDLTDFAPEWFYLDSVCLGLFKKAAELVAGGGGHFFVTVLAHSVTDRLRRQLDEAGIPVVDAGLSEAEFTCLPDDNHPNALANRIYAERIHRHLVAHSARRRESAGPRPARKGALPSLDELWAPTSSSRNGGTPDSRG